MTQSQGPFCQSCSMPMETAEMFGTNADASKSEEYCTYCYQSGKFMDGELSMEEMIEKCATIMGEQGIMPETQARDLLTKTIPTLKRWKGV